MPKYTVTVEFKVRRAFFIPDAADENEAAELAIEEAQNGNDMEATAGYEHEVVDISEEDR